MRGNIWAIMKKEFARFFGDRRMVVTALLPGVMIYLLYTFMGSAMQNLSSGNEDHIPVVYAVHAPASIRTLAEAAGIQLQDLAPEAVAEAKASVTAKTADICVVFPVDFDAALAAYTVATATEPAPSIEMYYNGASTESDTIYRKMSGILDRYESSLANKFDVNLGDGPYDLATNKDTSGKLLSTLLPLLLLIFLYSGCVAIAPESIAGEKERGTIATLLVTPMKRSELAIGKILSLALLAFLCGLSSTFGTLLSLPKLMGGSSDSISMNIYGMRDYLSLGLVILSSIVLIVTLVSLISAFAKTVKEANASAMPLMIVVMLAGVSAMFGTIQKEIIYYFVPLYNSVQCMSGIFSFDYSFTHILITIVSNLVYACIGGFVLTRMFNSERVIFSR